MVERVLAAIRLLTLDREQIKHQDPQKLIQDYWQQKQQGDLSPQAQTVERVLHHWYEEIKTADIQEMLAHLESQPDYQCQDCHRLENLPGYLEILKQGPQNLQIAALEQIEKILLRIHNPLAIAWDFGGVLMDGHNKFFIELYAHSKEVDLAQKQLTELWQTIFKSKPIPGKNYDALKIGQATPEQFARHAIANFNHAFTAVGKAVEISESEVRHFLTLYYSHYDAKLENREVLQRISKLGIRQYGLTNNFMAKIEYFLERQEFDYLQGLIAIVSEKFGASKPAPRIYLSFKQHVFLDRFTKDVLNINLPPRAIEQLWQEIFAQTVTNNFAYDRQQISCEPISTEAIASFNSVLEPLGYNAVDVNIYANKWLEYWAENYPHLAWQTIFIDDKVKNLDYAFKYEEILGVHYDANQGQKIADIPEIEELLEQEGLKGVVRTLRELTATENSLGQRAKIALERLTPWRIRHEKLIWQEANAQSVIALSDEQIYALLQKYYNELYETHFKLGQLVSQQYALIYRLAILPEYTYDKARWIVLRLFETSELFLARNRDFYPRQEAEIPPQLSDNLGNLQTDSLLQKKLLPEIKRQIANFIQVLDVARQPSIEELLSQLQQAENLEILKQLSEQLLKQITAHYSQQIEPGLDNQANPDPQSDRSLKDAVQQLLSDFLPLKRLIADWEKELHSLEHSYFQQYHDWKTLKDRQKSTLYQDIILDGVREQFTTESLDRLVHGLLLKIYDLPRWKDLTKPTMILVSGASGSGKSTLSTQLARIFGIQKVFSTDEAGRANAKAILDFLFDEEAETAFLVYISPPLRVAWSLTIIRQFSPQSALKG